MLNTSRKLQCLNAEEEEEEILGLIPRTIAFMYGIQLTF